MLFEGDAILSTCRIWATSMQRPAISGLAFRARNSVRKRRQRLDISRSRRDLRRARQAVDR